MNKHYGQIIEKVIRRDGYSISELAKLMDVNRRSVYNWFCKKRLKSDIIFRIGEVLSYDFSNEFPELFKDGEFSFLYNNVTILKEETEVVAENLEDHWKDKYIILLEKYNELLTQSLLVNGRRT
jgi:transcriptional regulator with XRE-family HTH domain